MNNISIHYCKFDFTAFKWSCVLLRTLPNELLVYSCSRHYFIQNGRFMHACSLMTLMRMRAMDEIWIIDSGPGIAKSKDECYNWPIVWFCPADDGAQLLFPLHLDIIMVIFLCLKFLAFFPLRSFLSFECTSVCPLSLSSVLLTLRDCRQNLLKFVEGNFILYIHACRPCRPNDQMMQKKLFHPIPIPIAFGSSGTGKHWDVLLEWWVLLKTVRRK